MKTLQNYLSESLVNEEMEAITVSWGDDLINLRDEDDDIMYIPMDTFEKFVKKLDINNDNDIKKVFKKFNARYLSIIDQEEDEAIEEIELDDDGKIKRTEF